MLQNIESINLVLKEENINKENKISTILIINVVLLFLLFLQADIDFIRRRMPITNINKYQIPI